MKKSRSKSSRPGAKKKGAWQGTPRKRRRYPWYFRIVLILLPLLILLVLEGLLRLGGFGRPVALFLDRELEEKTYLQLNPEIARRFFPASQEEIVRKANFQILPTVKPDGTRRILCLGGSTTAGFPLPAHGAFPAILREILDEREPSVDWEVINLGVTALSSSSIASFIEEALDIDPDLLVLYFGHNEFYGAGGVATPGVFGLRAELRKLRIARLIEQLLSRIGVGRDRPQEVLEDSRVRAKVPVDSEDRAKAYDRFRKHLEMILDAADRRGTEVILCEVASNERDLYPLGSIGIAGDGLGRIGLAAGRWPGGRPSVDDARAVLPDLDDEISKDSLHAGLYYLRGIARLALGDEAAREDMITARNVDAIPFRAPDSINTILREVSNQREVNLVPVERILREESPDGILGHENFVEHLHLTYSGSARIALSVAEAILGRPQESLTNEEAAGLLERVALTPLDCLFADVRMNQLLGRWPFDRKGDDAPPYVYRARSLCREIAGILDAVGDSTRAHRYTEPDQEVQELAQALLNKRTNLVQAHTELARAALGRGDAHLAAEELHAAARLYPVDATLWTQLADLRLSSGDVRGARRAAEMAIAWNPSQSRAKEILKLRDPAPTGAQ